MENVGYSHLFLSRDFLDLHESPSDLPPSGSTCFEEIRNGMYEGEMLNGLRSGYGVFIWDDSSVYIGKWSRGFPQGIGHLFKSDGNSIHGSFESGQLSGRAILRLANGSRLLCNWRNSRPTGVAFSFSKELQQWTMSQYNNGVIDESKQQQLQQIESRSTSSRVINYLPNTDCFVPSFPQFSQRDAAFFDLDALLEQFTKKAPTFDGERILAYIPVGENTKFFGFARHAAPEGLGVVLCNGHVKNVGSFKDSLLEGLGRVIGEDGLIFDGEFNEGHLNGVGFLYSAEADALYEGFFSAENCKKLVRQLPGLSQEAIGHYRATRHRHAINFANDFLEQIDVDESTNNCDAAVLTTATTKTTMTTTTTNTTTQDVMRGLLASSKLFMEGKQHNIFYQPKEKKPREEQQQQSQQQELKQTQQPQQLLESQSQSQSQQLLQSQSQSQQLLQSQSQSSQSQFQSQQQQQHAQQLQLKQSEQLQHSESLPSSLEQQKNVLVSEVPAAKRASSAQAQHQAQQATQKQTSIGGGYQTYEFSVNEFKLQLQSSVLSKSSSKQSLDFSAAAAVQSPVKPMNISSGSQSSTESQLIRTQKIPFEQIRGAIIGSQYDNQESLQSTQSYELPSSQYSQLLQRPKDPFIEPFHVYSTVHRTPAVTSNGQPYYSQRISKDNTYDRLREMSGKKQSSLQVRSPSRQSSEFHGLSAMTVESHYSPSLHTATEGSPWSDIRTFQANSNSYTHDKHAHCPSTKQTGHEKRRIYSTAATPKLTTQLKTSYISSGSGNSSGKGQYTYYGHSNQNRGVNQQGRNTSATSMAGQETPAVIHVHLRLPPDFSR